MKKFLLSIAVALTAFIASAKEDIDTSALFPDGGNTVKFDKGWLWLNIKGYSTGELKQNEEAKTTDDSEVVYTDMSKYDYIIMKYSSATTTGNIIIQYNSNGVIGQWGPEYYTSQGAFTAQEEGGYTFIKLDPDHKNTVNTVAVQNGNDAGELTIEEIYFATEEEYEAAKKIDDSKEKTASLDAKGGEHVLAAGDYGWDSKWLDLDVTDYNSIVFVIESVKGKGQITLQGKVGEEAKEDIHVVLEETSEPVTKVVDISEMTRLSQYAYQNLNGESKETIEETTIKVTKVYLSSNDAYGDVSIANVEVASEEAAFNLFGQKSNGKGFTVKGGKIYLVK